MNVKKITALIALVLLCSTGFLTAQSICNNGTGQQGGYTYEYWKDNGSGCMELGPGGTFSINWNNINNLLARKGLRPGSWDNVVTYEADYRPNGNSYLCIYGWTTDPLVEYYIIDSYGTWKPPGSSPMGTMTSDGGTYEIFKTTRVNMPSIVGDTTFDQYWSVRTQKITKGTITVGNHFRAWEQKGLRMGNMYEVSFCVEGYQSSGTANVTKMEITNGQTNPTDPPTPVVTPGPTPVVGPNSIIVRAMGTVGGENLDINVDGRKVASFSLTTTMADYVVESASGSKVVVDYTNDDNVDNGMDVQLDYINYHGDILQAEDQEVNTAVWQDSSCGGSFSDMMHCSGYIEFVVADEPTVDPGTPTPSPVPTTPPPAEAELAISPATKTVGLNKSFTLGVALSSSRKELASYGIDVKYDTRYLSVDTAASEDGAEAGADGYMAAANPSTPGVISITGFDVNGKGPGSNLDFLTLYLKSGSREGTSEVAIEIRMATDASTADVGTNGISGSVTVSDDPGPGTCNMLGDGNKDSKVDIVDALLAAQLYVAPNTNVAAPDCLDVNCSDSVDIVDALLIAQYYVGSLTSFPCN